ncbi:MAG: carboxypeptidase regulatory-like domain-containing protein [Acidobacteria bacterium]|nr:carboxypeptidase regulatory-like domain-containing protein [Acidobacteriota bacterium]
MFRPRLLLFSSLLFLTSTSSLYSQDARGALVGTVSDTTGAVIAGVQVDVTNKAMGTKISLRTNEAGFYIANFLIPGTYSVSAEHPGFKKFVRDNVEVRVNDRIEVGVKLEVGSAEQSVTVTAETALLNTESASLGTVVDGRRVAELPIPHGNPYFLIGLAAGVSFTRDPRLDRPFEPTHIVGYTMDGTRANRSDVTIDGAVSTATANGGEVISSYVPPTDIVAEFKVQTATFDASFGQTEGGVTNISLKSGTNSLHGTAYYSNMTPGLFANDFFANATNTPRPDFYYHRWGASAGGPVYIPKVYDGRNRTFFMWGYEGIKEARPRNNGTPTVPTQEMKNGDFSRLLALNSSYQVYNPFTRRAIAGGRFESDPFPGNRIPASLFNPIAKKSLDTYFPAPKSAGNPDGTNNYLRPELQEEADYYTNSVRVDHNLSQMQRIFVRASWYDRNSNYNNYFDNLATGEYFLFSSRAGVIDDVITLNPTTVLNLRYGYNRFIRGTNANPGQRGFDLTSLGFPASYNNLIDEGTRRFPRFDITGYQGTGIGGEYRPNDTHNLNASIQKAMGTHSLKGGLEFRAYRETDIFFGNNQTGQFNFDASWTRGPLDNSPTAPGSLGQSVAAMLLGLPASSSFAAVPASYAEQSLSWGFYIHDDWKVNNKLTLNMGLRWEFENALTERYNRSVTGFDFTAAQPFEAQARANYAANPTPEVPASAFNTRGGLQFAGLNGQSRSLYNTPKRNLMPRFGFAYKATDKTIVRGGYGVFFGFLGQRRGDVIQSGFSRNTPFVPTLDNVNFINTLSNPFPTGFLAPLGAAQGAQTFVGQSISFFNANPKAPYMQRWQLGIQRELGNGFVFDIGYVGNRGTAIEIGQNLNVTPQQYLSKSLTRDNATINYLSANLQNPFRGGILPAGATGTFTGANIARERLLRPYPHFDAINQSRFDGYSWYHSLQANIEKRFSKGYTVALNYTFSKFMQASETYQADDPRPVEVISDMDRPHRIAMSGIWELPFGRGKKFMTNAGSIASRVVGGWQLNGVYTYQSGAPINWGNIIFGGNINNIKKSSGSQTVAEWFNTGAGFEKAAAQQLASNVRWFPLRFGFIRADNINNFDLSMIKNTQVFEKLNIQFKAEFLNALNHPLFPAPNTTPTVSAFGQIAASNQANYPRRTQLNVKFIF